jgi:hypothetical protein
MQTRQQYYLAELSSRILLDKMVPEDRHYLASCIYAISLGHDPQKIFKTANAKGARIERLQASYRTKMAIRLVAAYMRPKYENDSDFSLLMPSGEGLSEKEALKEAYAFLKNEYGTSKPENDGYYITFETLVRYWNDAKKNKPELLQPFVKFGDLLPE